MRKLIVIYITLIASLFSISSNAQPTDWIIDPSEFASSMTFTWQVKLPDNESVSTEDFLAAFVDGECRGVVKAIELNQSGEYYFLLLVYSDADVMEKINFKYYNSSANEESDYEDTIDFESEKIIGSFANPMLFVVDPPVVLSTENEKQQQLSVFPIPASNALNLTLNDVQLPSFKIIDLNGKSYSITSSSLNKDVMTLDISSLRSGVYVIYFNEINTYAPIKFIKR